ncbi:MAG: hypothetical protein IAF94_19990 [Pirellulaceae bacterium]|nr:hypothetical protein [Pirellulaceae bacterium]
MSLSTLEKSLLLGAYYRGMPDFDEGWSSNSDQVVTLSLYFTGELSSVQCVQRFHHRNYVGELYNEKGELATDIKARYLKLIKLLREHPELIRGGGNLRTPADPTFTSCRLTRAGVDLIPAIIRDFPAKPEFPNWPDKRKSPDSE